MRLTMRLWKVLNRDEKGRLVSCHGGATKTGKPVVWTPGKRKAATGPLELCKNGIHLCRDRDLVGWLHRCICPVTAHGLEIIHGVDKIVVRWATIGEPLAAWNDRTAREYACDCAERVAHLGNERVLREAIAVARRYARGEATDEERAAAWDAAWAAAGAAAWAAAWDAAWAAAGNAAWAAEYQWQTEHLLDLLGAGREEDR